MTTATAAAPTTAPRARQDDAARQPRRRRADDPLHVFRDMLARWTSWSAWRGNKALGFAQSNYSEYTGSGGYGPADPVDDIDPDVLSWDAFFRSDALLPETRQIIALHYLAPGPVKVKYRGRGDQNYYAERRAHEQMALAMWLRADPSMRPSPRYQKQLQQAAASTEPG